MHNISHLLEIGVGANSRVLVFMPHPDDEAVFVSGLLAKLTAAKIATRVVTVTKGEKSTLRYTLAPKEDLATVREKEITKALGILGVSDFEISDLPDGGLDREEKRLRLLVQNEIEKFKPTQVVTLEPDGIYGHPDHIALSQIVTQLVKPPVKLWYVTVSPRYKMPGARRMAKKKEVKPLSAKFRLRLTFQESRNKIGALKAHKSQFEINLWHWKVIAFFLKNDMLRHEYLADKSTLLRL